MYACDVRDSRSFANLTAPRPVVGGGLRCQYTQDDIVEHIVSTDMTLELACHKPLATWYVQYTAVGVGTGHNDPNGLVSFISTLCGHFVKLQPHIIVH